MAFETAMTKDKMEVPVVDFAEFLHGPPDQRTRAGKAIMDALRNVGFVYLVNHGIPDKLIKDAFHMSRSFFDLALEDKMKAPHPPESWHHRGYSRIGQEKLSQYPDSLNPDKPAVHRPVLECKESFDIGRENDPIQPNVWPPDAVLPGFRWTNLELFPTLHGAAMDILRALAVGLELPDPNYFDQFHSTDKCCNQLRLLHYPAVEERLLRSGEQQRIFAHTDKGTITLLFQEDDGVGGLEVESPHEKGVYIPVPVVPGAVLVNVGDLLQMWSNDVLKSTRHRVSVPLDVEGAVVDGALKRRFSIPYFIAPDRDVVVECLETCKSAERPQRYARIKAWEWIDKSMSGAY